MINPVDDSRVLVTLELTNLEVYHLYKISDGYLSMCEQWGICQGDILKLRNKFLGKLKEKGIIKEPTPLPPEEKYDEDEE